LKTHINTTSEFLELHRSAALRYFGNCGVVTPQYFGYHGVATPWSFGNWGVMTLQYPKDQGEETSWFSRINGVFSSNIYGTSSVKGTVA